MKERKSKCCEKCREFVKDSIGGEIYHCDDFDCACHRHAEDSKSVETSNLRDLMNATLPPIDTSKPPKFCRCTSSSVAHIRGCWEGWGDQKHVDSSKDLGTWESRFDKLFPSSGVGQDDVFCLNEIPAYLVKDFIAAEIKKAQDEKDVEWLITMNEAITNDLRAYKKTLSEEIENRKKYIRETKVTSGQPFTDEGYINAFDEVLSLINKKEGK